MSMLPSFELAVTTVASCTELPNAWPDAQIRELLVHLKFEDTAAIEASELRSYAIMALQDLEDHEAAAALLDFVFGDEMTTGKKQNLGEEMTKEPCWEEYADLDCHERIFNVHTLLNLAHDQTPLPEIHRIEAVLRSLNEGAESWLLENCLEAPTPSLPESLLVRCIAAGLPNNAILNRLFEDQIKSGAFVEAAYILWQIEATVLPADDGRGKRIGVSLYSPIRWTGDLHEGTAATCEPHLRAR